MNETVSSFKPSFDGSTSLGDYSGAGSFGKAFNLAHKSGGSGHTFKYNGQLYNTNCSDGGNFGKNRNLDKTYEYNNYKYYKHLAMFNFCDFLGNNKLGKFYMNSMGINNKIN